MKIKIFRCKFFKPCKKILNLFKFKFHKPVFIRTLKFHHRKRKDRMSTADEGGIPKIMSVSHSLGQRRDVDQVTELKSFSDGERHRAPCPSPLTPAYVRMSGANRVEVKKQDEVEDACRSFENYLIEMIVEEGKMRDLVDVEELLYCWKNLRSPVFIDLVCRFYGELCKDLFSNSCEDDSGVKKEILR